MSKKLLSLYIHYPFCKSKCSYCDFYSVVMEENIRAEYLKALKKEIINYSKKYRDKYSIATIYIGGGTPSLMTEKDISFLLDMLRTFFNLHPEVEITIEVNPESFTESLLKVYLDEGINRISMGVQTLNNKILKILNRPVTNKIIFSRLDMLKKYKIKNFSVDLIYGLPYQTFNIFKSDVFNIMRFKPKHLSLYNLMIKKDVKLYNIYKQKPELFPTDKDEFKYYKFANNFLLFYGLKRYEISNFAGKNFHSYHNLRYWLQKEYLGLGPAAVSTINSIRWKNVDNVLAYIKNLKEEKNVVEQYEKINNLTYINEKIMLNLRLRKGINLKTLKTRYNIDLLKLKKEEIYLMRKNRLIKLKNNHLYLTLKGIMLSNSIMSKLFITKEELSDINFLNYS